MKKPKFQRCLRAVGSMTSAKRQDLKVAIEWRDKKDLVAEVVSLVGTPTACSHCHTRRSGHGGTQPDSRASGAGDTTAPSMR
jgi:hypothetical protein